MDRRTHFRKDRDGSIFSDEVNSIPPRHDLLHSKPIVLQPLSIELVMQNTPISSIFESEVRLQILHSDPDALITVLSDHYSEEIAQFDYIGSSAIVQHHEP